MLESLYITYIATYNNFPANVRYIFFTNIYLK